MTIRKEIKDKIKKSNQAIASLMVVFDRGQKTIENWLDNDDIRLTTPAAAKAISNTMGISESQIFETSNVAA